MALGIGQSERGAPGAAINQPVIHRKREADGLHIVDQVMCGVVRKALASIRRAFAAAALVELDDAVKGGIEVASGSRRKPGTGAAMQQDRRPSRRIAGNRHMQPVLFGNVEENSVERGGFGKYFGHPASLPQAGESAYRARMTVECQPCSVLGLVFAAAHAVVGKCTDDVAILDGMAVAMGDDAFQLVFQFPELGNFFAHIGQMFGGDAIRSFARHLPVLAERDQLADGIDVQSKIARMADEGQPFEVGFS